jgi:uncharacterized SAM-binding protein YcdF (DUF218 family)
VETLGAIIMLGGSGMPSESNLMRSWYTARAAVSYPEVPVVVVMPGDPADAGSTPAMIRKELMIRGVDSTRIRFENEGTNTRSQALACAKLMEEALPAMMENDLPVMLVTSPENMRRSLLCFRKAGFSKVTGLPAFENAAEADFTFRDDDLGSDPVLVPDVGNNLQLRYQVWTHLRYEILFMREMLALAYYRLRGWT